MASRARSDARPLAIVHVHWAFPPTVGGVESHLADLARVQSVAGHEVTVVTGEPEPIRSPLYEVVTTPLLDLDVARRSAGSDDYRRHVGAVLAQIVRERRPDVVHGHNLHHFAPEPALALDERWRVGSFRLYHSFHETWPDVLHDTPVYRRWDGNYAVSRFVQRQCASRLRFRPTLLSPGIDTQKFRPVNHERRSRPTVLHPARLLPWKGVHVTVRAIAALRDRGVDARLVLTDTERIADWDGELASYRRGIVELIAALGLEDVELRRVRYAEMPELYGEADVVVYPTVANEPFGLVPLEAMSCAKPVVGSASGGIAETLLDGETGYIVPPDDVDALAERVARLLRHPEHRLRLGAAARVHVLRHFDLARFARRLERLYRARNRGRARRPPPSPLLDGGLAGDLVADPVARLREADRLVGDQR